MKKLLYIAVLAFVFNACGGDGGGDDPEPTPVNNAPNKPIMVYPGVNEECIDEDITFRWNSATDPDGDAVSYTFDVALDQAFSQIQHTIQSSSTSHTLSLEKGVRYYWRILAKDAKDNSGYTDPYQFYTQGEGETNQLPTLPKITSPELNSEVTSDTTTLTWEAATDATDGDALTYDVYYNSGNSFDETMLPYETGISGTSIDIPTSENGTYYWRVDVVEKRDRDGVEEVLSISEGQVWLFTKTD